MIPAQLPCKQHACGNNPVPVRRGRSLPNVRDSKLTITTNIVSAFTPTGRLRVAINMGNPVLAGRDAAGEPTGVSVDLAKRFAQELDVECDLVLLDSARKSVASVATGAADVGFFAIDPARAVEVAFTDAYVLIEGSYLVRQESRLESADDVDRAGHRVTVGAGSAYDLFLTRELKQACVVRASTSPAVVETFLSEGHDVAAGVTQQLEADAHRFSGVRLLPGKFMTIRQAMGVARVRGPAATRTLADFVENMKATGFVGESLTRHRIEGAAVAPCAS